MRAYRMPGVASPTEKNSTLYSRQRTPAWPPPETERGQAGGQLRGDVRHHRDRAEPARGDAAAVHQHRHQAQRNGSHLEWQRKRNLRVRVLRGTRRGRCIEPQAVPLRHHAFDHRLGGDGTGLHLEDAKLRALRARHRPLRAEGLPPDAGGRGVPQPAAAETRSGLRAAPPPVPRWPAVPPRRACTCAEVRSALGNGDNRRTASLSCGRACSILERRRRTHFPVLCCRPRRMRPHHFYRAGRSLGVSTVPVLGEQFSLHGGDCVGVAARDLGRGLVPCGQRIPIRSAETRGTRHSLRSAPLPGRRRDCAARACPQAAEPAACHAVGAAGDAPVTDSPPAASTPALPRLTGCWTAAAAGGEGLLCSRWLAFVE